METLGFRKATTRPTECGSRKKWVLLGITTLTFPTYGHTNQHERLGVNAVAETVARVGLLWRETPSADVGIDGPIEYVTAEGATTEHMVAVQIKSGPTFLKAKDGYWVFHPEQKHRFYWARFPIPVLVVLHDPDRGMSYWQDVRRILQGHASKSAEQLAVHLGLVLAEQQSGTSLLGRARLTKAAPRAAARSASHGSRGGRPRHPSHLCPLMSG